MQSRAGGPSQSSPSARAHARLPFAPRASAAGALPARARTARPCARARPARHPGAARAERNPLLSIQVPCPFKPPTSNGTHNWTSRGYNLQRARQALVRPIGDRKIHPNTAMLLQSGRMLQKTPALDLIGVQSWVDPGPHHRPTDGLTARAPWELRHRQAQSATERKATCKQSDTSSNSASVGRDMRNTNMLLWGSQ